MLDTAQAELYIGAVLFEKTERKVEVHCCIDDKSLLVTLDSSKSIDDKRLRLKPAVLQDMLKK